MSEIYDDIIDDIIFDTLHEYEHDYDIYINEFNNDKIYEEAEKIYKQKYVGARWNLMW